MTTYNDLKSAKYIESIINYAEGLLNQDFKRTGNNRYSAYCPFHADNKDSFRVYVDGKDEVRFHCFGECKVDWDIYDLIMARNKCSFRQAQETFADFLGIKDFIPHKGKSENIPDFEQIEEPDESIDFAEPEELSPEIIDALGEASVFYNELLLNNAERFQKIHKYLSRRGVNTNLIRKFNIGFAPTLKDEEYLGRALIRKYLNRFDADYKEFHPFYKGSLVRLLNDGSYYMQYIDFSMKSPFTTNYADYFAGRITFPIYNIDGKVHGFVGRRLDNRGIRWMCQQTEDTAITTKNWLYGIDKAYKHISHYKTVILVEGIFDYFAFYNLLQDMDRPIIVSTLGSNLTGEARAIFKGLGVENFIVAYDCDSAGRKAIEQIATDVADRIYYLGGMTEGQDPADKLKDVVHAISGFSVQHLMASAKRIKERTGKPILISHITTGKREEREIVFKPASVLNKKIIPELPEKTETVKEYYYDVEDFLPLLSYDHGNKAALDNTLYEITKLLEAKPEKSNSDKFFTIPTDFLKTEAYDDLGASIILWLRIVIEQQSRKRKIRETDRTLSEWLNTSRATISIYKHKLKDLGYLNIDTSKKLQKLSVRFFPKQ
jgi:DNA primase